MKRFIRLATTTVIVLMAAACDDPVTVEELPGTYVATTFTVTEGGATEDLLEQGAFIDLTLSSDRSTSGQLFVPGGEEDGSDLDADLVGTWSFDGERVSLDHSADTFLRDMTFSVSGSALTGEASFGGATLRVVLRRA